MHNYQLKTHKSGIYRIEVPHNQTPNHDLALDLKERHMQSARGQDLVTSETKGHHLK